MILLKITALRCVCLASFLPLVAFAANEIDFEDAAAQGHIPDGCQNPFRESVKFVGFFDDAIATLAAERGANARGVKDLFAVQFLVGRMNLEAGLTGGEESPIDRLVTTQICHYEKVATQKSLGTPGQAKPISARDPGLHDHLVAIAPKLLSDAVALYRVEKRKVKNVNDQKDFMSSRRQQIRQAKESGEDKARSLIR